MNMQRAKMADKFLLCLEANIHKVLIAEYQRTSLRSKKSEFIQTSAVKLRELHSVDLSSHMRR